MSDYDYEGEDESNEPLQWRTLNPKERLELMKNIFTNSEWYDGTPFSEGGMPMGDGSHNPDFQAIVDRSGAPMKDAKRYYAAWLSKQGLDPKSALEYQRNSTMTSTSSQGLGSMSTPIAGTALPTLGSMSPPTGSTPPTYMQSAPPPPPPAGGNSDMWAMMQFMMHNQAQQAEQQRFQMTLQMEQRRMDELRNGEMRREQMARDQQFMQQQTTLLRESFKKANDTGFGGKLMEAAQEKMIEDMLGGKDEGWRDSIKDVLGSDTLKEAVAGIGGALGARRQTQIPAGYDDTQYNPYAQPMSQQVPQPIPQPIPQQVQQPLAGTQYANLEEQPMDGVFFEEGPAQPAQPMQQSPPVPTDLTRDEYSKVLFESFSQLLGPQMEDPQVTRAVQEQIEVAVDVTLLEMPQAIPQIKLQAMSEKMLLVRNLRDICFGLRDLRSRVNPGEQPGGIILAAVISELRKRPEFYKIFSDNSYEEIIAHLEPFKDTGAIKFDYEYLIRPEIAEIARHLLGAVASDKAASGVPQ